MTVRATGRVGREWSQPAALREYHTREPGEEGIGVATRTGSREHSLADRPELTDERIAALACADQRYFGLLYERYADRLYWYASVRTGSATVADDVVSETMIAVIEQIHTFDPRKGSFATWIFTIAHRKAIDQHRYHQRLRRFLTRNGHRMELLAEEAALDRVLRAERTGELYAALRCLRPDEQEIVALRYSAELSSSEIGGILGISAPAARKRLSRAIQRLDEHLRNERPDR